MMIHYYIENNGKVLGPLNLHSLKEKKIHEQTLIWRHGFKSWTPAQQVDELKYLFMPGPPPLPAKKEKQAAGVTVKNTTQPVKRKARVTTVYDERYRKETEATTTGIILLLAPILFIIFYKRAFYHSDNFSYLKQISLVGALVIRGVVATWVMRIARRQNRDTNKWTISAVIFPALTMIVIGMSKKLYDPEEWKQHLYNEKRQKSNAYFHAVISERISG